ncbi:MAG: hypothetical protein M3Y23_06185 [Actinomycetota bacterium]|nr:hypothetical protein [Actinomycetota bacterium]
MQSKFHVDCAPGLGWFGPYFTAGTISPQAGASSPFALRINKPDGQSDMNGIALSLPEGLLANLKGNVGTRIGTATVAAGPGSQPFWLNGPVVLEGPYDDAPFSLRVTVPAVAGPFNLGDVVVRQKIYVDPTTAQVTVVSDPLPTIVKGVPVRLQNLNVDVDKPGFMLNPTSCAEKSIGATLQAATGQTAAVASRFQVGGCENLPLKPKLSMDLVGKKEIKRGKHPKLSTTVTQQPGEAGLKKVEVRLPLSLALDPDNAQALCKPEQAVAKACPAGSIVGQATAISPVLNRPLTGDVFFVEGTRQSAEGRTVKTMPRLWVALRGEVSLDVWADSSLHDSKYLVTTFPVVPDAPISSFKLDIDGGKNGILAVTGDVGTDLCQRPLVARAQFDGQNGKRLISHPLMGSPCKFRVQDKTLYSTRTKVRVSGIEAGKLKISGTGVKTTRRTIKNADVASISAKLTAAGKRAYKGRKAIRLKVSFDPKVKGVKTKALRTTVKRAAAKKKSSTRSQRSR